MMAQFYYPLNFYGTKHLDTLSLSRFDEFPNNIITNSLRLQPSGIGFCTIEHCADYRNTRM